MLCVALITGSVVMSIVPQWVVWYVQANASMRAVSRDLVGEITNKAMVTLEMAISQAEQITSEITLIAHLVDERDDAMPVNQAQSDGPQACTAAGSEICQSARWIDHLHCDVAQTAAPWLATAAVWATSQCKWSFKEPQKAPEHRTFWFGSVNFSTAEVVGITRNTVVEGRRLDVRHAAGTTLGIESPYDLVYAAGTDTDWLVSLMGRSSSASWQDASLAKNSEVIVKLEAQDDSQVHVKSEPQDDSKAIVKPEPQDDPEVHAQSARWIDQTHGSAGQTESKTKRSRSQRRHDKMFREPQEFPERRFITNFVLDPQKTHTVNHEVLQMVGFLPMAVAIGSLLRNGAMWLGLSIASEISTAAVHAVLVVDTGSCVWSVGHGVCGLAIANLDDTVAKYNDPKITGHKAPLLWLFNVANNHYPVELPASTWRSVLYAAGTRQMLEEGVRSVILRLFEIPL
eukprot:m51a1_g6856 hypothetical protein (457) ;mRNA; f:114752-123418